MSQLKHQKNNSIWLIIQNSRFFPTRHRRLFYNSNGTTEINLFAKSFTYYSSTRDIGKNTKNKTNKFENQSFSANKSQTRIRNENWKSMRETINNFLMHLTKNIGDFFPNESKCLNISFCLDFRWNLILDGLINQFRNFWFVRGDSKIP